LYFKPLIVLHLGYAVNPGKDRSAFHQWLLCGILTLVFLGAALGNWRGFEHVHLLTQDLLASLKEPVRQSDPIVVVAIDDDSLAKVGGWPWPRTLIGDIIERLRKSGAKVIGVGVLLSEPDHSQGMAEFRALERKLTAQVEALNTVKELRAMRRSLTGTPAAPPVSRTEHKGREVELRLLQDLYREILRDVREAQARLDQDTKLASVLAASPQVILPMSVEFGKPSGADLTVPSSVILANAVEEADEPPKAIRAVVPETHRLHPPLPVFQRNGIALGHAAIVPDDDGIVRHDWLVVEHRGRLYPSFALRAAAAYLNLPPHQIRLGGGQSVLLGPLRIPTDRRSGMRVTFYGTLDAFKWVSAHQVLSGDLPAETFRGKVALLWPVASGNAEFVRLPEHSVRPSVELTANAIQTILDQHFTAVPTWNRLAVLGMLALVAAFLLLGLPRLGLGMSMLAASLLLIGWFGAGAYVFVQFGYDIAVEAPALLLIAGMTASGGLRLLGAHAPRQVIAGGREGAGGSGDRSLARFLRPAAAGVGGNGTTAKRGADGTLVLDRSSAKPTLGRYEILEELGRGAMGVVYLGHDPKIHRSVAIKTVRLDEVDPDQQAAVKERFFREAESAGQLSHPNIVTIYDAGEEDGLGYIAMEILDGVNLKDRCRKGSLLPVPRVLEIVAKVAEALDYAHSQGIVHRDVKPSNIMLMPDGTVKVTDFGIARMSAASKTQSGVLLGTPSYMSPQQLEGNKVDGRSDLFSLGVVLFELLTGEKPFEADTVTALMFQIVNQPHPLPGFVRPDLPPECDGIVDRALRKDLTERYQRGVDMARDLRACLERLANQAAQGSR